MFKLTFSKLSIILVSLFLIMMMSCTAADRARREAKGGWVSTRSDYIVVNYSGSVITDVWKLKNVFVIRIGLMTCRRK